MFTGFFYLYISYSFVKKYKFKTMLTYYCHKQKLPLLRILINKKTYYGNEIVLYGKSRGDDSPR